MTEPGRLVVVATPIGNLDDLSPRAAAALRDADVVACEDTRRTAVLLRHAGADTPMVPVHAHNEARRAQDLAGRVAGGATVALVSDAGQPAVSDPGGRVIAEVLAAGGAVEVIPGPTAVTTALVASGLAPEPFAYIGFFPRARNARAALLDRFDPTGATIVGFESPRRLGALLAHVAERHPRREVAVCRELTKVHEEVIRGTAADLAERLAEPPRGEVTVVLGPVPVSADDAAARLVEGVAVLLAAGLGPARAADAAAALGLGSRNSAYRAALAAASRSDR